MANIINNGPAKPAIVHNCMLISDIVRKRLKEKSDTMASDLVLAGQETLGKMWGMVFDSNIPVSRQVTNNGNLKPKLATNVLAKYPIIIHTCSSKITAIKFKWLDGLMVFLMCKV